MTIYFNPYFRGMHRHAMAQMMNDMDNEYEPQVAFPIDVKTISDSYEIKALLPGVDADNLNIQIVNEVVTISGEMIMERDAQSDYLIAEIPSGKFHRVISLPTPLDSSKVEATLESGILTLVIPKAEEARPKSIKIQKK
jgi:HSP20 family protein